MDKLCKRSDGCWYISGKPDSLFTPKYFKERPLHPLAAQARAIENAEQRGEYIGLRPISFNNLKTEKKKII